ncbi:heme ABC exporter ATP-binding protein CcmA [Acetobacter sp. AN02]|uniref:heme ABC exporter ATP-binding protein CcmA n=1 Tax=Acetobacter sp. AN02 TaxID=2894186 RepID=UPI002434576A|nr:heme ABC exporter ATP-binding protein CcmA [Acetobacter sp. AN02]MDG6093528.1 heme ABC exporter ATP-binding protein CcmA [Acetobacter sp. AN02]
MFTHSAPPERLQCRNLSVLRGDRLVLDNVSFTLRAGEAMLLTGPNGAGKSTLLRTLAGLRRPDGGRILWDDEDMTEDRTAHGRRIGWLGHQDALKPGLTLLENLRLSANGAKPEAALRAFDLDSLADLPARMLSAGQKRRSALARVLLADAPLWLLDEPSVGLDQVSVGQLGVAMAAHRAQGGIVIATTHVPLPLAGAIPFSLAGSPADSPAETGEYVA